MAGWMIRKIDTAPIFLSQLKSHLALSTQALSAASKSCHTAGT